jgi:hypothetical protein
VLNNLLVTIISLAPETMIELFSLYETILEKENNYINENKDNDSKGILYHDVI